MSDPAPQEEPTPAWQWFLYSVGCIGLAILIFFLLKNMEETGQGGRMNWLIVLLYKIGGKWTAAGVLGVLGILFAIVGVVELTRGGTEQADDDEEDERPRRRRRRPRAEDSEDDDDAPPPPRRRRRRDSEDSED